MKYTGYDLDLAQDMAVKWEQYKQGEKGRKEEKSKRKAERAIVNDTARGKRKVAGEPFRKRQRIEVESEDEEEDGDVGLAPLSGKSPHNQRINVSRVTAATSKAAVLPLGGGEGTEEVWGPHFDF